MTFKACVAVLLCATVAGAVLPAAAGAQGAAAPGAAAAVAPGAEEAAPRLPEAGAAPVAAAGGVDAFGYPASARKDYILACVNVNGGTEQARTSCGCSMDVIASILPYERYDQADTILRMRRMAGGYLAGEFRVQSTNQTLDELREAQAEGEVRCF
ncbi:MAG: hypothetical protein ACRYG6_16330 [Janthinobacterium lividum]